MEQENKRTNQNASGGAKKVLKKGAFVVICIVIAVLLLAGSVLATLKLMPKIKKSCRGGTAEATPTPEPTPVPAIPYIADRNPASAPPLDKLGLTDGHLEEYGEYLSDVTRWIDMTPDGAKGYTVIRSIDLGVSYVVKDGEYFRLGEGEDGKGVLHLIETDMNGDDEPDLLYTYHFGANEDQCSKVGWFDFADPENKAFSGFSLHDGFLVVVEENGEYVLLRAERSADIETGSFGLTPTERVGVIVEQYGGIFLIME
jgi:hypothetical protein